MSEILNKMTCKTNMDFPIVLGENDIDDNFDIEMDVNDSIIQTIDGVVIAGDYDEVKLRFVQLMPEGIDMEEEIIRCRCIAELRVSRKKFIPIAKELNRRARTLMTRQKSLSSYTNQSSMYV